MEMTRNMLLHLLEMPERIQESLDFSFSQIQFWEDTPPQSGTLYLTTQVESESQPFLLPLDSLSQINHAFQLHQHYLAWREQCLRNAQVEHDLNTLLEISSRFLGWAIWIVSPDYRMDAGAIEHFPGHRLQAGKMSQEAVKSLYHDNPSFEKTFLRQGIQPYPQYHVDHACHYYYNIFQESLYLGRLLYLIPDSHENPGALALMALVSEDVAACYRFLYLRRRLKDQGYRFYDLWKALLTRQPLNREIAEGALHRMGWQITDTFQVLYMTPVGYFYDQQTMKYFAVQMESTFGCCVVAELEDGLYGLHNLTRDHSENFRQHLGEFLRENLFRVGISNSFQDFFDSPRYRQQAQDAMSLGLKRDPSLWRFDFSDYVSDYALRQCLAQYPAVDLCPPNLRLLLEYEERHPDTELVRTLRQYYACQFNAQLAAQKLFIHRTTFFYRMNKIQQIAAFHPDDPVETAQIMLAFQALTREKNENKDQM